MYRSQELTSSRESHLRREKMQVNNNKDNHQDKSFANENSAIKKDLHRCNISQVDRILVKLQESLSGLTHEQLDHNDTIKINMYRLKIIKGLTNRELDFHTFQVGRLYGILADYLKELYLEEDKRAKYGLIPVDGCDWEPATEGRPSIGPMIEPSEEDTGDGEV